MDRPKHRRILNAAGNVLGMMPHPSVRSNRPWQHRGRRLFEGLLEAVA